MSQPFDYSYMPRVFVGGVLLKVSLSEMRAHNQ